MSSQLLADGSAAADAPPTKKINRAEEPYRWRCPNGHTNWDRTNNHAWCPECRRCLVHGTSMKVAEAEHYELVDAKTGKTHPYHALEFVEDS